jgi:hypothetical protein
MCLNLTNGDLQYHDLDQAAPFFSTVRSPIRLEAYGVYNDLTRINLDSCTLMNHVELDHSYYGVLVSTDGTVIRVECQLLDWGRICLRAAQRFAVTTHKNLQWHTPSLPGTPTAQIRT